MDNTQLRRLIEKESIYRNKLETMGVTKKMTRQDLIELSNRLSRFTVPKSVRINKQLLDKLVLDGVIKYEGGTAKTFGDFRGLPVIIDNSIHLFKFEY